MRQAHEFEERELRQEMAEERWQRWQRFRELRPVSLERDEAACHAAGAAIRRHGSIHRSKGRHPYDGTWRTCCDLVWDRTDAYEEGEVDCEVCAAWGDEEAA